MAADPDFAGTLDCLITALSISLGRLALARRSPGFTLLDCDRPLADFIHQFSGVPPPQPTQTAPSLALHHDVMTPARLAGQAGGVDPAAGWLAGSV